MASRQTIAVSVIADTSQFRRAMGEVGRSTGLSRMGALAGKAGQAIKAGLAVGGAAMTAIAVKGVNAAADLEQSVGAIDDVFKDYAGAVHDYAAKASTALGLSENSYNELATLIGSQLKNGGTAMDQLGAKTNDLIKTGADLSAMFGGSTTEAVQAISSALKGERDPIERYGVTLKQAAIDAKAAEMGFSDVKDSQAQQAATLALIAEQTTDAAGKFEREAATFAHVKQVALATLENWSAKIGAKLLPALTSLGSWVLSRGVPAIEAFASKTAARLGPVLTSAATAVKTTIIPALQTLIAWLQDKVPPAWQAITSAARRFGPALAAGAATIAVVVKAFQAFQRVKTIITAVRTAVIALNAAMAANPIGLVAAALAALVAGLVYAYQHSERFREIVQAAWQAIQDAASAVVDWFTTTALPVLQQVWEGIQTAAQTVGDWFTGTFLPAWSTLWDAVTAYASAVWDRLRQVWDTVGAPIATLIISIWQGVAANWSSIWDGISTYVSGAWQVISTIVATAINVIRGVIQAVTAVIRGDWSGAWEAIRGVASSVWAGIQGVISGAINMVQGAISTAMAVIRGIWSGAWNGLRSVLSGAWNGIKSAVSSGVSSVVSTIRGLPGQAASALGNIGSTLLNAGKNLIQGFINGITSKISGVKDTLSNLTSKLTSWKGPEDLDRRLLTPAGRLIIDGLVRGLESRYGAVRASLRGLTDDIAGTDMPALAVPGVSVASLAAGGPAQGGGGDMHVTIQVQALTPTPEVGRIIAQALEDWQRRNGAGRGVVVA